MSDSAKKITWFSVIVVIVAVLDQWSKSTVWNSPELHRQTLIDGWLMFNLTTNPGMAMGISWAPTWVISIVAILATIAITWYAMSIRKYANLGFMICMGLIIGGAIGNILDRFHRAISGGYGGVLEGHVVDFIHFTYVWPEWVPFLGGNPSFPYIFNVADIAISVAIITLLVFAKWLLPDEPTKEKKKKEGQEEKAAVPPLSETETSETPDEGDADSEQPEVLKTDDPIPGPIEDEDPKSPGKG